jgi:hypothetical protein
MESERSSGTSAAIHPFPFWLYLFVLALAGCDALVLLAKYEAALFIT